MIETRYARNTVRQDKVVVGHRFDGMPVNAAGEVVLTPLMRLERYYLTDDGHVAKKASSPDDRPIR
jgi:hypothetical protein